MNRKKIIALTGPTASGKSKLGFDLAKQLDTQIISSDSRLVYRNFKIAAAKPDDKMLNEVRHHLVNFVDPQNQYTAGDFAEHARKIIEKLHNQGKIPILVGGTYLYFKVLLEDYELPQCKVDRGYRDYLNSKSDLQLYDLLVKADFEAAQKIHVNNRVKVIRYLELIHEFDMTLNEILKQRTDSPNEVLWFGLEANNREFLYERINNRVENMINDGLLNETISNYKKYEDCDVFLNTIGYKELVEYIKEKTSFEQACEKIKQHTRNYAKRQLSFMKTNENIKWFDIEQTGYDEIFEKVSDNIKRLCC